MPKMIVMNVCAKHPPYDGRVYDKISKTLVKCGYEVHNSAPNSETLLTSEGIYIHGFLQKSGFVNRIRSHKGLMRCIVDVSPDCMICHEPDALFVAYKYYRREKRRRHVKLYFDCHEAYEHWFDHSTSLKLVNYMLNSLLMFRINSIVKRIDGVTSVNNTMTERFKKYNSCSYFLPSVYKRDSDVHFKSNKSNAVVYMGQFGRSKQTEMFIGAARILKEKGYKTRITVIGGEKNVESKSGSFKDLVNKEQLTDYFDFKGWMPREEAFLELSKYGVGVMRFDSYTMPGNYAMPNKLFEYMSMGLAILSCSLNCEIKKIIEDYNCGVLISNETADDLADALIFIEQNPDLIEKYKENAYIATAKEFNWERYSILLRELIEK